MSQILVLLSGDIGNSRKHVSVLVSVGMVVVVDKEMVSGVRKGKSHPCSSHLYFRD